MPAPVVVAAGVAAFLKGLSALMRKKSNDKKDKEDNRAKTAAATLRQKRAEDTRRARVRAGASFLGNVPETTAGGAVRTNVRPDPAIISDLEAERTYDFGEALPAPGTGSTYDFLSGLFGEASDTVSGYDTKGQSSDPWGGILRPGSPGSPLTPPGGVTRTPWNGGDEPGIADDNAGMTIEDLLELLKIKPGGGAGSNYTPDPESGGF